MFCVTCGQRCPDDATYCISCGKPIPENARVAAAAPSTWSQVADSPSPWATDSSTGSWAPPERVTVTATETRPAPAVTSHLPSGNDPRVLDELPGWNWGAFFLPLFWALGHGLYMWAVAGLLLSLFVGCVPVVNVLFAVAGNKEAWKTRHFASIQEFQATQKAWATAGGLIWSLFIGLGILSAFASNRY